MVVSTLKKADEPKGEGAPTVDPPVVGSGNFLADRGHFDPDETRLKFLMSNEIALIVDRRRMTQTKVAELAGMAQADVSRIVNGAVKDYSVWRLMRVLNSLGKDILVEFSDSPAGRGQVFTNFVEKETKVGAGPSV
jgi:predicted XRE-type DNA-binding protein